MKTMASVDHYIENVIKQGDQGSKFLAASSAQTLKNNDLVDVLEDGMNGLAVLRIPEGNVVDAITIGGDPKIDNIGDYAASAVERAAKMLEASKMKPIAFADVIDSSTGDITHLKVIQGALVEAANKYKIPIINGENAILGNRVNGIANITVTMLGMGDQDNVLREHRSDPPRALFDPHGKPVYVCCDGIGTKGEIYERKGVPQIGLQDAIAMKADDAVKIGAHIEAICENIEYTGDINHSAFLSVAHRIRNEAGIGYVNLTFEEMGGRIASYKPGVTATNISGSAIATIDEARLADPLRPREGDTLIAIRGQSNPRSNGISARRALMVQRFGPEWHTTEAGEIFMDFLASPSTIFYSLFSKLVEQGLATSVFHLSGGAYDGKLARPLAKHGLYAEMTHLFPPDWRDLAMVGFGCTSAYDAYRTWPMGNEAFISTQFPDMALDWIDSYKLQGRIVGTLRKDEQRTGIGFQAANGKLLYFSGKD